jgi:hypothetical protein
LRIRSNDFYLCSSHKHSYIALLFLSQELPWWYRTRAEAVRKGASRQRRSPAAAIAPSFSSGFFRLNYIALCSVEFLQKNIEFVFVFLLGVVVLVLTILNEDIMQFKCILNLRFHMKYIDFQTRSRTLPLTIKPQRQGPKLSVKQGSSHSLESLPESADKARESSCPSPSQLLEVL